MAVDFNYINERMLIGGYITNQKEFNEMQALGVTHFLCLLAPNEIRHDVSFTKNENVTVKCLSTFDDLYKKDSTWFKDVIEFANSALNVPGSKLYIHCMLGKSRSALAWYTILRTLGFTLLQSQGMILNARWVVNFNDDYTESAEEALESLGYVRTTKVSY